MSRNKIVEAAYDEIPYPSGPHVYSHPSRLAALASQKKLQPAPVDQCRVLEIGGSDGGNMLPMALDYPQSQFVCVDISTVQIEMGRKFAKALDLRNLEFHAADLAEFDWAKLGKFDYVIAHGVFSWVDRPTQDALLNVFQSVLSKNGLGYLSYNAYPGWHVNMALREMMLRHVAGIQDPRQRVSKSIELASMLAAGGADRDDPLAYLANSFLQGIEAMESPEVYVAHEYLSQENSPLYYSEFVQRLQVHGLCEIGEAKPTQSLKSDLIEWISKQTQDEVARIEYQDFFAGTSFRRSVLGHKDPKFANDDGSDSMFVLLLAKSLDETGERWRLESGKSFSTSHALAQKILRQLANVFPQAVSLSDLMQETDVPVDAMGQIVSAFAANEVVEIRAAPLSLANQISERPTVSRLVRYQIEGRYCTTQLHRRVKMDDETAKSIVSLLDGTRTPGEVASEVGVPVDEVLQHLGRMIQLGIVVT